MLCILCTGSAVTMYSKVCHEYVFLPYAGGVSTMYSYPVLVVH